MSKYKLLAIDMDGTALTSQKKISPRTNAAVNDLLKRGVHVVASTGRGIDEIFSSARPSRFTPSTKRRCSS